MLKESLHVAGNDMGSLRHLCFERGRTKDKKSWKYASVRLKVILTVDTCNSTGKTYTKNKNDLTYSTSSCNRKVLEVIQQQFEKGDMQARASITLAISQTS